MTATRWTPDWFDQGVARQSMVAWRGVEAQHVLSTTRLVDDLHEHEVLEGMLEASKPPAPVMRGHKHYLIYTPFRYRPRHPSRFRRAGSRGQWYGAEELYAACAEVAYWRHRFVMDSQGLADEDVLTAHTFFQGAIDGVAIDLTVPPWVGARDAWTLDQDYTHTHAVAEAAAERRVQWIRYESVRAPGRRCAAVLDVEAVDLVANGTTQQTWQCKANRATVMMLHDQDRHSWTF
ncbi:RES family NAD+ phosphorylase [Ramlibacter sp. AW1]|uniref:RES family NAD+ phosphorylase n=1 Tax=Ramlibacter aurantiacus TaxID=2801330 RepID=A0A937D5N2_9BURK|nr:RES family NAD+ phosphorylase [Ramlibacter aurantiacus]MBL0422885.1 RES family NAD+ phosphorylase [Ramlibacter aurantiacus]